MAPSRYFNHGLWEDWLDQDLMVRSTGGLPLSGYWIGISPIKGVSVMIRGLSSDCQHAFGHIFQSLGTAVLLPN